MRVHIIAVGRLKAGPERELAARYLERLAKAGPAVGVECGRTVEITESRAGQPEPRKREEGQALVGALPNGATLLALDEAGAAIGSQDFADWVAACRDDGARDLAIAIGGPDGHAAATLARADRVLSLGRMTWPHQIVRILAAEQLYRAVTILAGHPYHRP